MKFFKKFIISSLCLFLLSSASSVYAATATEKGSSDDIYNKYSNFDLQNYSLSFDRNKININSKCKSNSNLNSFIALPEDNTMSNLNSIIDNNPAVKDAISKQLKNGNTIVGLSVTERYLEENYDEKTKRISYRFLTNKEVEDYNKEPAYYSFMAVNSGQTQRKGKLTLTSILITSPSLTGQNGVYNFSGYLIKVL